MGYKILVVDDEELIREGIKVIIERLGMFEGGIRTAANGTEALRIYTEFMPQVILTDIKMPEIDGLELIRKIREKGDHGTKVIIISGYGDFDYARTAIKYGVVGYLLKPVNRREIAELLQTLICTIKSEEQVRKSSLAVTMKTGVNEPIKKEMDLDKKQNQIDCNSSIKINISIVEQALEYIDKNYASHITLVEVSNHINMNDSYFSTLFKKTIGKNFIDYLTNFRIEKAKEYLMNPQAKVYEISSEIGYMGEKHFFKVFKKITGLSPNEYRNNYFKLKQKNDNKNKL